jgi:hypothetical protein
MSSMVISAKHGLDAAMSRKARAEMLNIVFIYLLDESGATMLHAAERSV